MANDVAIRVTVSNDTARGIAAVNTSLRALRTNAATTGGSLDDLSGRSRSLRSDMDELDGAFTRAGSSMGGLRGSLGSLNTSSSSASDSMSQLKSAAITLSPALIPIASSLAPIAVEAGAAGIAVAAFGAAIIPQVSALSDAAKAQGKYTDAVTQYGARSPQAVKAQQDLTSTMGKLPPATRTAAAAFQVLSTQFKGWSNSLAGDTMPVATKAFAVLGATVGHLTPLVKDSSTQLGRMMTILAGGVQSSGFDKLVKEVDDFAHKGLVNATTGLLRFGEALQSGTGQSQIQQFMAYAHANGPLVADTMKQLSESLLHLVEGASDVGVSMLTIVNVFAKLVNAVPPELIGDFIQLAVAIKAVKIASAGGAVIGTIATEIRAAGTAAVGSSGTLRTLGVAFGALSKSAKIAVAGTGIGLLIIALGALSQAGKTAPPDVDKLTTSLGKLAQTGRVSGEAARAFGGDLSGLSDSLRVLTRPSTGQAIDQWIGKFTHIDNNKIKESKADVDSVDKALAGLVQNGHADLAAAALNQLGKGMDKNGLSAKELRGKLDDYKQSLTDAAFEAKLAAQSQGLFGEQAQKTQAALDQQKNAAQGLQQAIFDLNDTNRSAYDAETKYQQSIDDATQSIKENGKTLSANSEAGRSNRDALSSIASSSEAVITALVQQGAGWDVVSQKSDQARAQFIKVAMSAGDTRAEATKLADQLLKMPNKTVYLKGQVSDLNSKIKSAQKTVDALKQKRAVAVGANKGNLDAQVSAAQRKVDALKQKRAVAIRASNQVGSAVAAAQSAIARVQSKTVNINAVFSTSGPTGMALWGNGQAHGGIVGGFGRAATGGPRGGLTLVGEEGPELVNLGAGSRVHSHPDTKRMLAGGTAGGSSQPIQVALVVDGKTLAQAIFDPLRAEIHNRKGGNVQAALGWNR